MGETYLQDISKLKLIPESKIKDLIKRSQEGDNEARNEIILGYLRWTAVLANRFNLENKTVTREDLINEGVFGIMDAIYNYSLEEEQSKFITYSTAWINGRMQRALENQDRTIRNPVYIERAIQRIKLAQLELTQEYQHKPSTKEISEYLNIPIRQVEFYIQSMTNIISTESVMEVDEELHLLDALGSDEIDPAYIYGLNELKDIIQKVMKENLTQKEQEVLNLRFGLLNGGQENTLASVGKEVGLTGQRVSQIQKAALKKLSNIDELKNFMI